MTIIEASKELIPFFETNDSFNMESDFQRLFPQHITETPEADMAAVAAALELFREQNLLKKNTINNKDYYVLYQPLSNLTQNVTLSYITTKLVSDILYNSSKQLKDRDIEFNPLQLEEKDILLALSILHESINKQVPLKNK